MYKQNHMLGGVLLVSGTTIGAAMLAVPVTTAFMGFWPSLILFAVVWCFMLFSAFFFIDVNCAYKDESNIITMAGRTLGTFGKVVGWLFYMLLLYALIAAYISSSADIFTRACLTIFDWHMPMWMSHFALPAIFGGFLYGGMKGVDLINRLFMAGLLISYLVLIFFVPSHIEVTHLNHFDFKLGALGIPVVITSFGYHIIIPSLGTYLNHDRKQLRKCVLIGSVITLIIYTSWQVLVLGVVPLFGENSMAVAWVDGANAAIPLANMLHNKWIALAAQFFSFFAIITSFLGVSLSLSDFLIDGFKIKKTWEGKLGAILLTFIPPLVFVFNYQRGFLIALEYAGAFVAVLLIFLPAAMAWKLKHSKFYTSVKGRLFLSAITLFAIFIVVIDYMVQRGLFRYLLTPYIGS
ncbi:MAG: aromatic amino acid transport family protein [Rhabdochlamydiaceae bacterium]|nr:aromatic amino acid transport family protein [Candidatus Amphrikana amoebophyrae]